MPEILNQLVLSIKPRKRLLAEKKCYKKKPTVIIIELLCEIISQRDKFSVMLSVLKLS